MNHYLGRGVLFINSIKMKYLMSRPRRGKRFRLNARGVYTGMLKTIGNVPDLVIRT